MGKFTVWAVLIVVVAAIIGGIVYYSSGPSKYDGFAACIAQSGTKFYGAFWCPHCQEEKSYFGRAAEKLPYIECSTPDGQGQTQVCKDQKIEGYPTWVFANGTRESGTLSLEELASSTGCALPAN